MLHHKKDQCKPNERTHVESLSALATPTGWSISTVWCKSWILKCVPHVQRKFFNCVCQWHLHISHSMLRFT